MTDKPDHRRDSINTWTVTVERSGDAEWQVRFTEAYGDDFTKVEIGYPCDVALAVALGEAIKAVSPSDEQPWRLAVVVQLLLYLARFDDSPELDEIAAKAREVFEAL